MSKNFLIKENIGRQNSRFLDFSVDFFFNHCDYYYAQFRHRRQNVVRQNFMKSFVKSGIIEILVHVSIQRSIIYRREMTFCYGKMRSDYLDKLSII